MRRLPGWLIFILFVPLQVYLFLQTIEVWGFWKAAGVFLVLTIITTRATRPMGLRVLLFPMWAHRWQQRRHVYQGVLFLIAALTYSIPWGSQPWLAAAAAVGAIKAFLR